MESLKHIKTQPWNHLKTIVPLIISNIFVGSKEIYSNSPPQKSGKSGYIDRKNISISGLSILIMSYHQGYNSQMG